MFRAKPVWLKGHELWGSGLGYAEGFGEGKEGIFFLAESLGEDEERQGKPLVGKIGQMTARMISRTIDPATQLPLNLDRDFYRTNAVPFKPPFNKLDLLPWPVKSDLLTRCRPTWTRELERVKPKVIFSMGDLALKALGGKGSITKVRGAIFQSQWGPVVPTYHTGYLVKGKLHLTRVWRTDLKRALFIARHGVPKYAKRYDLVPNGQDAKRFYDEWVAAGRPPIAFDIETPHPNAMDKDEDPLGGTANDLDLPISTDPSYTILRSSFSWKEHTGITMPWCEPFISWAKLILREMVFSGGWNSQSFDVPRLEANGCEIGGEHVDLMWLWHLLEPALPMGLKPTSSMFFFDVPPEWASREMADTEQELYSVLDSDFTLRLLLMLVERAKREGKWGIFEKHYVRCGRVLRAMSRVGVKTDPEIRRVARDKFEKRFLETIAELQAHVPQSVLPRKVFKKTEEQLRKQKPSKTGALAWVEGRMIQVEVWEKPKHEHAWAPKVNELMLECACGKTKKPPKEKHTHEWTLLVCPEPDGSQDKLQCDCGKTKKAPKPKKPRKKKALTEPATLPIMDGVISPEGQEGKDGAEGK